MSIKKSGIPILWPVQLMIILVFTNCVFIFVIALSFSDATWENALYVTRVDRSIALVALTLFCFNIWYIIGLMKILQQKLSEDDIIVIWLYMF